MEGMALGKGAEMLFAERFNSARALIVERSEGSEAAMLLDERSRVCSEEARLVDVKIGPNDARDWPFTILRGMMSELKEIEKLRYSQGPERKRTDGTGKCGAHLGVPD